MIQALGALHRLTVKGTRTFHTPSLNSLSLIRSAPAALLTSTVNDAHKRRQSEQQQRQPQKRERKRTTTSRSLPMAAENRQQITWPIAYVWRSCQDHETRIIGRWKKGSGKLRDGNLGIGTKISNKFEKGQKIRHNLSSYFIFWILID